MWKVTAGIIWQAERMVGVCDSCRWEVSSVLELSVKSPFHQSYHFIDHALMYGGQQHHEFGSLCPKTTINTFHTVFTCYSFNDGIACCWFLCMCWANANIMHWFYFTQFLKCGKKWRNISNIAYIFTGTPAGGIIIILLLCVFIP